MTLTAIIGAFVALLPTVRPRGERDEKIEALQRQLADANRELAVQEGLAIHWRETAQRIARNSREARERQDDRDLQRQYAALQAQQALYQPMQQHNQGLAQQAQAQYGLQQALSAWDFCNCVPGRSQVFEAERQRITQV